MSAQQDIHPAEPQEWLDPLEGVIQTERQDHMAFLPGGLRHRTRRCGTPAACSAATPCVPDFQAAE